MKETYLTEAYLEGFLDGFSGLKPDVYWAHYLYVMDYLIGSMDYYRGYHDGKISKFEIDKCSDL